MILNQPTPIDAHGITVSFENVLEYFEPDSFMHQKFELIQLVYDNRRVDRISGTPSTAVEDAIQEFKSQQSSLCGLYQPMSNIKWLKSICQQFTSLALGYEFNRRFHITLQAQFSIDPSMKGSIVDIVLQDLMKYPPALAILDLPLFSLHFFSEGFTKELTQTYEYIQKTYIKEAEGEMFPELKKCWFYYKFQDYSRYNQNIQIQSNHQQEKYRKKIYKKSLKRY